MIGAREIQLNMLGSIRLLPRRVNGLLVLTMHVDKDMGCKAFKASSGMQYVNVTHV